MNHSGCRRALLRRGFGIALILLLNLAVVWIAYCLESNDVSALSRVGSQGEEVRQIQETLNTLGYSLPVDGIYGSATQEAVRSFQQAQGLTADGIAGTDTLAALGITQTGGSGSLGSYSSGDIDLLARIISAEARGEPYEGQVAVGAVILNRIASPSFPDTLAGVIYQKGAFSCLTDGGVNAAVADSAYQAARDAINGYDPTGGAIYYYNPQKATSQWIFSRPVMVTIGAHRFCS